MKRTRVELLLGILFVALVIVGISFFAQQRLHPRTSTVQGPVEKGVPPPGMTPQIAKALNESHGFQYVISYTSRGFEPPRLSVKVGETVRFVNNTTGALWVANTGDAGALYPSHQEQCGQSDFDSCGVITSGAFWEMTFVHPGTWSFKNNAASNDTGVVIVVQ